MAERETSYFHTVRFTAKTVCVCHAPAQNGVFLFLLVSRVLVSQLKRCEYPIQILRRLGYACSHLQPTSTSWLTRDGLQSSAVVAGFRCSLKGGQP